WPVAETKTKATSHMIGKKHRKPARKAAMRRAATLPMIVRKALKRAAKELTATKARAENR
ncbi:Uncharacterized protein YmdF, partial [Pseudomonas sp. FG-3G]